MSVDAKRRKPGLCIGISGQLTVEMVFLHSDHQLDEVDLVKLTSVRYTARTSAWCADDHAKRDQVQQSMYTNKMSRREDPKMTR